MNRRAFIKTAGFSAAACSTWSPKLAILENSFSEAVASGKCITSESVNDELTQVFSKQNDVAIDSILAGQQNDKSKPFFGGFADRDLIFSVGRAAAHVRSLACGLVYAKSKHFGSAAVETSLSRAMQFVVSLQHADGTIDLVTTNFHSPPDTGFVVEPVAMALGLIRKYAGNRYLDFQKSAEVFLDSAGKALSIGGIHTPNHRWVVCQALARIHGLLPDRNLVQRVDQWLAEGIDIDSEGHFHERSTSVYSPLTDRCLITVARLLDRPDLLEPVRKNLELTRYLVHPNGEIVTEVSRRQDQFRIAKMGNYYYPYRYMAIHDSNGQCTAMARMIEDTVGLDKLNQNLAYVLEDATLLQPLPKSSQVPTNFVRSFSESKIVRIRRDESDATILADNETFLTFQKGNAALRALRIASAFFGKGQFKSEQITQSGGSYILKQTLQGPYYQPLPKNLIPDDGDWKKMPIQERILTEVQNLESVVTITEQKGALTISVQISGTERVPVAIELAFGKEGKLEGVDPVEQVADAFLLKNDGCSLQVGDDQIKISGATPKHRWIQLRGALPKLDAQCVYITDYTPVKFELTIS